MGNKLTLGYDASCGKCAQIAGRIGEASDGRLEVLPLTHPDLSEARRSAFGENPPHQPTLVEIKDGKTRAWVGRPLAFALVTRLGVRRALSISSALADLNRAPAQNSGVSRATFLKGVLGAGAGLALLGAAPTSAFASNSSKADTGADGPGAWLDNIQIASSDEVSTDEAKQLFIRIAKANTATSRMNEHAVTFTDGPNQEYRAVKHRLQDGRTLEAASLVAGAAVLFTYSLVENGKTVRSHSRLLECFASSDSGEIDTARLLMAEDDGETWVLAAAGCNQTTCRKQGPCFTCTCTEYNLTCMFNCCGPCALACGNIVTCLACVGLWCPTCATVNKCCNKSVCGWRQSCA